MKPKVLLIYTGGTIGMMSDPNTGALRSLDFEYIHQQIPEINRLEIQVSQVSIKTPVDSSYLQPSQWIELVEIIELNHMKYDGFVVLHGTDTMAYTASALSFLIQGLNKPIVLTGSQLPVGILRSDGKENLLAALEIAGKQGGDENPELQEVAIFFQSKLFRGNRVSKISANQFDAFDSPNCPLLGIAGVDIEIYSTAKPSQHENPIKFYKSINPCVGLIKLYPGINLSAYASVLDVSHHKAVVIETFGSGNCPNDPRFEECLRRYKMAGGILVTITQCTRGSVQPEKYASGRFLNQLGAWNGKDLTTEAAITKLMWLFGENPSPSQGDFDKVYAGESL